MWVCVHAFVCFPLVILPPGGQLYSSATGPVTGTRGSSKRKTHLMVGSGRRFLGKHFLMMRLEVLTRGSRVRTERHSCGDSRVDRAGVCCACSRFYTKLSDISHWLTADELYRILMPSASMKAFLPSLMLVMFLRQASSPLRISTWRCRVSLRCQSW